MCKFINNERQYSVIVRFYNPFKESSKVRYLKNNWVLFIQFWGFFLQIRRKDYK